MFPHRRSTKVALETYPLHFEIIQFNKYNEKKVTAIFSQFRLQMELETKQGIPLTNHLLQFIFFALNFLSSFRLQIHGNCPG